jgi:hypothetical protein
MIEYIYLVKCPDRTEEPFDLFDEAQSYALGCLSNKPIITQIEVDRNDFGECTGSRDLGTVWSWEKLMNDIPAEPDFAVFTKDDFCTEYNPETDPEFLVLDNDIDTDLISAEKPTEPTEEPVALKPLKTPIPEGMTIKELVEAMEENEDTVECARCEDLFDKSDCHYEVDFGYLCSNCEAAMKSRGETLTFREGSYFDDLDEEIESDEAESDNVKYLMPDELVRNVIVKNSAKIKNPKVTNPLTFDDVIRYTILPAVFDEIGCSKKNSWFTTYDTAALDAYAQKANWSSLSVSKASQWSDKNFKLLADEAYKQLNEIYKTFDETAVINAFYSHKIDLDYDDIPVEYARQTDVDAWDEWTRYESYTYKIDVGDLVTTIYEEFLTDEDLKELGFEGGMTAFDKISDQEYDRFFLENFQYLFDQYEDKLMDYFEEDAIEAANNRY